MKHILVAIISLIILIPLLFLLPLGLSIQGIVIMMTAAFLFAVVGIFLSRVLPIWLVGLILLFLIVMTSYILESRFKRFIFMHEKKEEPEQKYSVQLAKSQPHENNNLGEWISSQKKVNRVEQEYKETIQQGQMEEIQIETVKNISLDEVTDRQEETLNEEKNSFHVEELTKDILEDKTNEMMKMKFISEALSEEENLSNRENETKSNNEETMNEYDDGDLVELLENRVSDSGEELEKESDDETITESPLTELEILMETDKNNLDEISQMDEEENLFIDPIEFQNVQKEGALASIEQTMEQGEEQVEDEDYDLEHIEDDEDHLPPEDHLQDLLTLEGSFPENSPSIENLDETESLQTDETMWIKAVDLEMSEGKENLAEEKKELVNDERLEELYVGEVSEQPIDELAPSEVSQSDLQENLEEITNILTEEEKNYIESIRNSESETYIDETEKATLSLFDELTDGGDLKDQDDLIEDDALKMDKLNIHEEEQNSNEQDENAAVHDKKNIQQQLFDTIIAQVEIAKKQIKDERFEELVKGFLHPSLSDQNYFTLATILIDYYIEQNDLEKLHSLLKELKEKFIHYPIINEEITYLYNQFF